MPGDILGLGTSVMSRKGAVPVLVDGVGETDGASSSSRVESVQEGEALL